MSRESDKGFIALKLKLTNVLIEVDYLISYGKVCEARTLIENTLGDDQKLNNQKGIKNV